MNHFELYSEIKDIEDFKTKIQSKLNKEISLEEIKKSKTIEIIDEKAYLKYLQTEIGSELFLIINIMTYKFSIEFNFSYLIEDNKLKSNYLNEFELWKNDVNLKTRKLFCVQGQHEPSDEDMNQTFDIQSLSKTISNISIQKAIILNLLICNLGQGKFDSRTKSLLNKFRKIFEIPYLEYIEELENPTALDLFSKTHQVQADEEIKNRNKKAKFSRWALTGAGATVGGVLLAVTGGLAAPLILPAIASILGAGGILAGATGVALVTSIFGATGAGYRMSRRVGGIKEFEFLPIHELDVYQKYLSVSICISGWLTEIADVVKPWDNLIEGEVYSLKFETEILSTIGRAIKFLFASQVIGYAASEVLKKTIINGLISAAAWPVTLLSMGSIIDNPWSLGLDRSKKAGLVLADALINRAHGNRPVSLIGYSLGALVIFSCLEELVKKASKESKVFGIIENVVLVGAPVTTSKKVWISFKTLVSGRIINGFNKGDWILSFMHRAYNYSQPIAGVTDLHKIWEFDALKDETLIESHDLSKIADGHFDYLEKMPLILKEIKFEISVNKQKGETSSIKNV